MASIGNKKSVKGSTPDFKIISAVFSQIAKTSF